MLRGLRESVKRIPGLGPALHHFYLIAWHSEGKDEIIRDGILKGMKFRRFMHTFCQDYVSGDYEPEIQQTLLALIKPGQVAYDVGANVGFLTLLMAKLVGPSGLVVAFEPGVLTVRQLRAQVEVNQLKNVIVEESAVSDRVGTSEFIVDEYSVTAHLESDHRGGNGHSRKPKTISVRTTTLDDVIVRHKPPHLIKMDIEGAELLALSGATRLLEEFRPLLVVELHSEELSRGFHQLMAANHYAISLPNGADAEPGDFSRFVVARPLPV